MVGGTNLRFREENSLNKRILGEKWPKKRKRDIADAFYATSKNAKMATMNIKAEANMMDTRGTKCYTKLAEWARLLEQQAESGMPVKDWCEEQGIKRDRYNYWQKRLQTVSLICAATLDGGMVPMRGNINGPEIEVTDMAHSFVKIPNPGFPREASDGLPAMSVRVGRAECEIYNGADAYVIERALLALGKI